MSWFCPKWFLFLISLVLGTMFHLAVPHTLAVLRLFSAFLQMFFFLSYLFFSNVLFFFTYVKKLWQMFSVSNVLFFNQNWSPLFSRSIILQKKMFCTLFFNVHLLCTHTCANKLFCSSIYYPDYVHSFLLALKSYLRDALFFQKMICETRYFSKKCSESAIFSNVLR